MRSSLAVRVLALAVLWAWSTAYWLAFLSVHLLLLRQTPVRWVVAVCRFWGRSALAIVGIELRLENPNPFTSAGPRVVVTNHQSGLDLLWGAAIYPPRLFAIGKREVAYIPVINLLWWGMGCIFIDRRNHEKAMRALDGAVTRIRGGETLVVAPEGTRSPDGRIGPFKKGAFHLAIQAHAPVVPMVVSGVFELMPKTSFLPRPGRVRLRFLDPEPTEGLSESDVQPLLERTRARMIDAMHINK